MITTDNLLRDVDKECVYVFITQQHLAIRGVFTVDNFGDGMTPEQIRDRMQEYDLLACNLCVPIVLLTTNRTVIDDMKGKEDCLYILRNGRWSPIQEVIVPEYLEHFALGDLYDRGEITSA